MEMNKNTIRMIAVAAIVLALFCVLAFATPFARGAVFWLGFGFTVLAILAQLYVAKKAFANGTGARSKFYGFPIARVGCIYLIVQAISGLVCMALGTVIPSWVAVVIFVLILAAAGIGFIASDAIRDETERQDKQVKTSVGVMRSLQSKAASLAGQCEDPEAGRCLQKLSDSFRFSDPVSSNATEALEQDLTACLEDIQTALTEQDYTGGINQCAKTAPILAERNHLCKLEKMGNQK